MLEMRKLLSLAGKKGRLMIEVKKLSEEEAKAALIWALRSWRKDTEIHNETVRNLKLRITELEEQCSS